MTKTKIVHRSPAPSKRDFQEPSTPFIVFGFNANEKDRIKRNRTYDSPLRTGVYPLLDWGWDRPTCHDYILQRCGIDWRKSACSFCPFCSEAAKGLADAIRRWNASPEQTAHGLIIEYNALCLNPEAQLFPTGTLMDVIRLREVRPVIEAFESRLAAMNWGLYRVRRIHYETHSPQTKTLHKQCDRSVELINSGSREQMGALFRALLSDMPSLVVETRHEIQYAISHPKTPKVLPSLEGFYVVAPAFMQTKSSRGPIQSGGLEKFNERWARVIAGRSPDDTDDLKQERMPLFDDTRQVPGFLAACRKPRSKRKPQAQQPVKARTAA